MHDEFGIHDLADFPLVRFRPEMAKEGFASAWMAEMDKLVGGDPFALLFPSMKTGESAEDYKQRGLWLKENHDRLAQACRVLVTVEPDDAKRREIQAVLDKRTRAFGVRQMVAADVAEAEAMCRSALARGTGG
jgi:hypothetical protein